MRDSVRCLCSRIAQDSISDDIGKTMQILQECRYKDPNFTISMDTDEIGRITSMLWCNGKNKMDFINFGDVVTFDTTYRTNLYNMPFGLFVGINQHFQSIVFGGVLLTSETTESFTWVFSEFCKMMNGRRPRTILTGILTLFLCTFST